MTPRARPALLPSTPPRTARRRGPSLRRVAPVAALAAAAFAGGVVAGAGSPDPGQAVAERFARAWERGDYRTMHGLLSPRAGRRTTLARLRRTYAEAASAATVRRVDTGLPRREADGSYSVDVALATRVFGTIRGRIRLPLSGSGDATGVDWSAPLAFPGLRPGERLARESDLAPRAAILARDGAPLAQGPQRSTGLGPLGSDIAGKLGPIPTEQAAAYRRRGIPAGTLVGVSGLEREFDDRLLGTPGGTLRAGDRVVARTPPKAGTAVRTSIDPEVQRAAVAALGERFGGIAVLKPQTGEVLALAGIAYSAPQPPGSTFKIITLAGALQAGAARDGSTYPVTTKATIEGVDLENANGESCGGTLAESFAESCNSVFAPLGVKLGAERLVRTAEAFGFNEAPSLKGAARSTIPPAAEIGDGLAVGSTAIGQGRVLATPLQMASVAATIAERGRRRRLSLLRGGAQGAPTSMVVAPAVARTVTRYMRRVVRSGTGTAAAIPGVTVAGKTGTAELRDTTAPAPDAPPGTAPQSDASDTDAWFAAFAPAGRPRVAVSVLLVGQGAGGDTAAPIAREVLLAALKATG